MDGTDTRRGQPAVHRRFAALHRGARLARRRRRRSASAAAILLGDLCLSWADEMLCAQRPAGRARCRAASRSSTEMRTELMAGQYLDVLEQATRRRLGRARAAGGPLQEREVHGRAAAAPRRRARRRRRRTLLDGLLRRTGCRSARRSSCATTCSASSATRPRPASRPATTCARASAPCWSRWRWSAADAGAGRGRAPPPRRPAPRRRRRRRAARGHRRHRRAGRASSG